MKFSGSKRKRRHGKSRVQRDKTIGKRFGEWCCDGNKIGAQRAYWRDRLKSEGGVRLEARPGCNPGDHEGPGSNPGPPTGAAR